MVPNAVSVRVRFHRLITDRLQQQLLNLNCLVNILDCQSDNINFILFDYFQVFFVCITCILLQKEGIQKSVIGTNFNFQVSEFSLCSKHKKRKRFLRWFCFIVRCEYKVEICPTLCLLGLMKWESIIPSAWSWIEFSTSVPAFDIIWNGNFPLLAHIGSEVYNGLK